MPTDDLDRLLSGLDDSPENTNQGVETPADQQEQNEPQSRIEEAKKEPPISEVKPSTLNPPEEPKETKELKKPEVTKVQLDDETIEKIKYKPEPKPAEPAKVPTKDELYAAYGRKPLKAEDVMEIFDIQSANPKQIERFQKKLDENAEFAIAVTNAIVEAKLNKLNEKLQELENYRQSQESAKNASRGAEIENTFYGKHADLIPVKDYVDYVTRSNEKTVIEIYKSQGEDAAMTFIAETVRKNLGKNLGNQEERNSSSSVPSANRSNTPPTNRVPKMTTMQSRGKAQEQPGEKDPDNLLRGLGAYR